MKIKSVKKIITLYLIILLIIMLSLSSQSMLVKLDKTEINNTNLYKCTYSNLDFNITIPDDYPTIQEGINMANEHSKIYVRSGIYYENILINKTGLFVQGENKYNTVIDIQHTAEDGVNITAEDVTFTGFTVTNARNAEVDIWDQSGIVIYSSNVTIMDNIISDNRMGLMSYSTAFNLTICENMFFYDGIFPANYLLTSDIPLESVLLNVYNNTVNGKPLYYLQNKNDYTVNSDAGQIILVNCTNVTVKNLYLTYTDFAILLYYCSNCLVENLKVIDTDGEVILFFSENNTIQNITSANSMHGICLDVGSKNNIVRYNEVYGNYVGISIITSASGNRIYKNKAHDNSWGIKVTSYFKNKPAHDNHIYENDIYDNDIGIRVASTYNSPLYSSYNSTINNNNLTNNEIGLQLIHSDGNSILNNTFRKNLIAAMFTSCSQTTWEGNYWNRPRMLPKPIYGIKTVGRLFLPWLNFDNSPAKQPTS